METNNQRKTHPTGGGRKPKFDCETTLIVARVPIKYKDEIKAKIYKIIDKYSIKHKKT